MISSIILSAICFTLPQGQALGPGLDSTPGVETVDERVEREAKAIRSTIRTFVEDKDNGLHTYESADGRVFLYTDFRSKEAKAMFKTIEQMFAKVDTALGEPGEEVVPIHAFLFAKPEPYMRFCDAVGAAGPSQADFMQSSKDSTGFTIFAPEVTTYFHDLRVQEEARADHSIAHNLIHLELHRRYGILPLWIRESIATAAEDMAFGEVYAPWHLNGFVFSASHGEWRGKKTREQIKDLTSLDALFNYSANPYREELAHLGFAFGVYSMLEEPVALQGFLGAMQERYAVTNTRGGRPEFTLEMFAAHYQDGFLERFQKWWKKPPRWNAKPKKRKK